MTMTAHSTEHLVRSTGDAPGAPQLAATVLIIEDEARIRAVVHDAISDIAGQWLEAATGAEGIAMAAMLQPDVIILDLGLPDMDGVAVCTRSE